jgi:hypothetical protein
MGDRKFIHSCLVTSEIGRRNGQHLARRRELTTLPPSLRSRPRSGRVALLQMRVSHTRSRYIYDLYYVREAIDKPLYDWLLKEGYADAK